MWYCVDWWNARCPFIHKLSIWPPCGTMSAGWMHDDFESDSRVQIIVICSIWLQLKPLDIYRRAPLHILKALFGSKQSFFLLPGIGLWENMATSLPFFVCLFLLLLMFCFCFVLLLLLLLLLFVFVFVLFGCAKYYLWCSIWLKLLVVTFWLAESGRCDVWSAASARCDVMIGWNCSFWYSDWLKLLVVTFWLAESAHCDVLIGWSCWLIGSREPSSHPYFQKLAN